MTTVAPTNARAVAVPSVAAVSEPFSAIEPVGPIMATESAITSIQPTLWTGLDPIDLSALAVIANTFLMKLQSDHSARSQVGQFVLGEPELLDQEPFRLLAQAAAGPADGARGAGKLGQDRLHPYPAQLRVGHRNDVFSRRVMRVGENPLHVIDRPG